MASQFPPIGAWYSDAVDEQVFEVVAVDEQFGTVEVQYAGGEISEFDLETWNQLSLLRAAPPEDAAAGYELSQEDFLTDEAAIPHNYNPLNMIEPDLFQGFDDF